MSLRHHVASITGHENLLLMVRDLASNDNVEGATVAGGGTGYVVGDILTVSGGTVVGGYTATLEVTSVSAGVIDGIRVDDCGAYSSQPANNVSVTGGTGTGATFTLTWNTRNWVVERDVANSTSNMAFETITRELILKGVGTAGTDSIYVGLACIEETARGSYNWVVHGMTGFNNALEFEDQPGNCRDGPDAQRPYTALTNGSIEAWVYVNPRWLAGVFRIGSSYSSFFMGFMNPYGTATDFPYPMYISGCTSRFNGLPGDSSASNTSWPDPGAYTGTNGSSAGCACYRNTAGIWYTVKNWEFTGSTRNAQDDHPTFPYFAISPGSSSYNPQPEDRFVVNNTSQLWGGVIPSSGAPGSQSQVFGTVSDSGDDIVHLVPVFVYETIPALGIQAEIPDVYFFDKDTTGIVSQDRIIVNGVYYRCFQMGNRTDNWNYFAIREDA